MVAHVFIHVNLPCAPGQLYLHTYLNSWMPLQPHTILVLQEEPSEWVETCRLRWPYNNEDVH